MGRTRKSAAPKASKVDYSDRVLSALWTVIRRGKDKRGRYSSAVHIQGIYVAVRRKFLAHEDASQRSKSTAAIRSAVARLVELGLLEKADFGPKNPGWYGLDRATVTSLNDEDDGADDSDADEVACANLLGNDSPTSSAAPAGRRRSARVSSSRKRRNTDVDSDGDDADELEAAPPVGSKSRPAKRRVVTAASTSAASLQQRIKTLEAELEAARQDTSTVEHELDAERSRVTELEAQLVAPAGNDYADMPTSPSANTTFDYAGPDDPFADLDTAASTSILSGGGRTSSPPTSPQRALVPTAIEQLKTVLGVDEEATEVSLSDLVGKVGERLATMEQSRRTLETELQSSQQRNDELVGQLKKTEDSALVEAQKHDAALREVKESLEQALRAQAEHDELVQEHNMLIATTVAARQSLAAEGVDPITTSLTQLADQASSSISALHADVVKLEAEKATLVEQNESVESARVKAEARVEELDASHKQLETKLAERESELAKIVASNESLTEEKAGLESRIAGLNNDLAGQNTQIEELTANVAAIESRCEQLTAELERTTRVSDERVVEVKALKEQIELELAARTKRDQELEAEKAALSERITAIETDLATAQTSLQQQTTAHQLVNAQLGREQQERAVTVDELVKCQTELEASRIDRMDLQSKLKEFKPLLAAVREERNTSTERVATLSLEMTSLESRIVSLDQDLTACRAELHETRMKQLAAEADSTIVRDQLDQLCASIDDTASKSQRVRQSLGSASTLIVAS